ncbi:MAG: oxidoreductase [Homoserinimonas sp.]|jgi:predicted dehydrogenase|nr:oxidoreductase [Mycetocola sp.]MCU1545431.1 oxidoreductase [Homoserinimonas sp.]
MTEALRWGIMGTGGIAHLQTSDLVSNGFTVTAVGSRSQASAAAFAQEFGIPNIHASYQALVEDPEVDIVYVSTPHPFHASGAKLALQAGKHVLLEKPFTVNAREAREVAELAAENELVVLEAMWTRFLPHVQRIREIIAAGALGEVRTLIADHNQLLPSDPQHRINNWALAGGALLDLGIYPVSFAHHLFGAPNEIKAVGTLSATGVDRQTAILLSFAEGQQAVLHTALDARGPNTADIIGTGGRIHIDSVWYTPTSFTLFDGSGRVVERFESPQGGGRGMHYQAWELERLVQGGQIAGEIMPPSESLEIMATLDEVRKQIGLAYEADRLTGI